MKQFVPAALHRWSNVLLLAVAAFIFNTTEFMPVALLSDIGADFAIDAGQTGIMLTVYAWVVACLSLPLMLLSRRMDRRRLLLLLLLVFTASHVLAALATSFALLLAARIGTALTHAIFWSITASLAVRLAPPGKGSQALGLLGTGTVLAMVLGLPLGRLAGQAYGWRLSLLLIGVSAVLVTSVLAKSLPPLPSHNSGSLHSLPQLLRRPSLLLVYALTTLAVSAHFTAYSYIEPFLRQVAAWPAAHVTLLLAGFGAAGFVASWLFGRHFDRAPRRFLLGAAILLTAALWLLQPLSAHPWLLSGCCVLWGAAMVALSLAIQSRVLHLAADATDVAIAIYSSLYNIGIGAGALLGAQVAAHWGLSRIGLAGGLLAGLAGLLLAWLLLRADVDEWESH